MYDDDSTRWGSIPRPLLLSFFHRLPSEKKRGIDAPFPFLLSLMEDKKNRHRRLSPWGSSFLYVLGVDGWSESTGVCGCLRLRSFFFPLGWETTALRALFFFVFFSVLYSFCTRLSWFTKRMYDDWIWRDYACPSLPMFPVSYVQFGKLEVYLRVWLNTIVYKRCFTSRLSISVTMLLDKAQLTSQPQYIPRP